ncbi:MAG: 23S rRNA (uracil(1939)-C(5))-methyltransferase RlmD [Rhabdochlamydiaceae bacterium]|nr:23S rRNA (uracil(1939)-C(5))-methyltransferase RlmD [Rhabdochlamydiaceae bacterium]
MKPQLQEILTLTIVRMGIHGEGVASHEGFTIFVEGALPKERVRASLFDVRKNYGRARVLEYLETSPHRVKPPCPVFGRCGGCQIMHLDYSQQLETKRQRVIDALERIGKIKVDVQPCIPSPSPFSYRNKIQLPYQDFHLGLYAFNSHDLVEIEKCYIHCPLGEQAFSCIKAILQRSPAPNLWHVLIKTAVNTDQVLVILVTDKGAEVLKLAQEIKDSMGQIRGVVQNINESPGNVILGKIYQTLVGEGCIFDTICGLTFKVSPASFFQVNPPQAENLYKKALEACNLKGVETVLDAYCGVGTLSLLLAQKAKKVVGVESVPEAIGDAQENAKLNQIENAEFTCAFAEDFIGKLSAMDVAVINPPRKGCEPAFLNKLIELQPKQIVYISCDPATLARDLAILQGGKYRIQTVQPFDMFPQTVHVETLVSLSLSG